MKLKTYACPSCGAEIAPKDVSYKTDTLLCRACGARASLQLTRQRELAQREPGPPPAGVQVKTTLGIDGPAETRLVVRHRSWLGGAVLTVLLLLLLWQFGVAVQGCFQSADLPADLPASFRQEWQVSELGKCLLLLPFLVVFGGLWLNVLFGRCELLIGRGVATYRRGFWKFFRRQTFGFDADTVIRVETHEIERAGHNGVPRIVRVEGIAVRGKLRSIGEIFFGDDLTHEAREYFVHHLVRAARM